MTKTRAKARAKTIRMPGKERRAASRLVIQKPLPTEPHHRNHGKKLETLRQPAHGASRRGSRTPIPSEPAPRHRPWITPQGATLAERLQP